MRSIKNLLLGTATASLAVLAASASHAQGTFDYTTVPSPSIINGNVLVTGATGVHLTAPTTGLTLATFNVQGSASGLNPPFTVDLTVNAPYNVPNAQTKSLTADLTGSFTSNGFLGLHTTSNSTSVTNLPTVSCSTSAMSAPTRSRTSSTSPASATRPSSMPTAH